ALTEGLGNPERKIDAGRRPGTAAAQRPGRAAPVGGGKIRTSGDSTIHRPRSSLDKLTSMERPAEAALSAIRRSDSDASWIHTPEGSPPKTPPDVPGTPTEPFRGEHADAAPPAYESHGSNSSSVDA